jgi:hypothetical protein
MYYLPIKINLFFISFIITYYNNNIYYNSYLFFVLICISHNIFTLLKILYLLFLWIIQLLSVSKNIVVIMFAHNLTVLKILLCAYRRIVNVLLHILIV